MEADEIIHAWPTPVMKRHWAQAERFNAQILAVVHTWQQCEHSLTVSNVGGWRSKERNLFSETDHAFLALSTWFQEMVAEANKHAAPGISIPDRKKIFINGWANISKAGDHNMVHIHPESMWSGVYYLSCTDPVSDRPLAGNLELRDPRAGCSMVPALGSPFGRVLHIKPEVGLLVLFPSWLPHGVHPVAGAGERVSIAFNSYIGAS